MHPLYYLPDIVMPFMLIFSVPFLVTTLLDKGWWLTFQVEETLVKVNNKLSKTIMVKYCLHARYLFACTVVQVLSSCLLNVYYS